MKQQLLEFFDAHNVRTEFIRIAQTGHSCNGVVATAPITQNQTIASIPLELIIFSDDLIYHYKKYCKYYPHIFSSAFNDDAEFNILVLYILQNRKNEMALHKPYFDYVEEPKNILSWSPHQVDSILDENLKRTIKKMIIGLQLNFGWFQTFYKEQFNTTLIYEEFLYAYQFVMTRCFGGDEHLQSSCLVPFGDMFNHHDKCQTIQQIQGTDLVFIANENIQQGEEIYNFFGEHGNSFLLCWYGFTYDENLYEKVYIQYEDDKLIKVSCYEFDEANYTLKKYKRCEQLFETLGMNRFTALLNQVKSITEYQLIIYQCY